jgi:hypothetical protein
MTLDFASLKKSSGDLEGLSKKLEQLNKANTTSRDSDDRFWQPSVDRAGNGLAVIRFLPAPAVDGDEGLPWVRIYRHFFKGPTGKWYVENSLTTIGKNDPLGELNTKLWATGLESNQAIVRSRKRKLEYISNIEVIKDPKNPENEGKVFLYRYGKKIMEKITAKMNPDEELGDDKVNVFDFWKGANFRLKIRKVDGQRNYDLSEFEAISAHKGGKDKDLEKVWKTEHSLQGLVAPDQFKSYDELKKRLQEVIGGDEEGFVPSTAVVPQTKTEPKTVSALADVGNEKDDLDGETPPFETNVETKASKKKSAPQEENDEDVDALFAKLAQDD